MISLCKDREVKSPKLSMRWLSIAATVIAAVVAENDYHLANQLNNQTNWTGTIILILFLPGMKVKNGI